MITECHIPNGSSVRLPSSPCFEHLALDVVHPLPGKPGLQQNTALYQAEIHLFITSKSWSESSYLGGIENHHPFSCFLCMCQVSEHNYHASDCSPPK